MSEYRIELGILQRRGGRPDPGGTCPGFLKGGIGAWIYGCHDVGDRFGDPDGLGKRCPWLADSLPGVIRALASCGTLARWHRGASYEKEIDSEGTTTAEYVQRIHPTACSTVMKAMHTALPDSIERQGE
jgi:hypothetical protein